MSHKLSFRMHLLISWIALAKMMTNNFARRKNEVFVLYDVYDYFAIRVKLFFSSSLINALKCNGIQFGGDVFSAPLAFSHFQCEKNFAIAIWSVSVYFQRF